MADDQTCVVCKRREPPVCDRCRARMAEQLASLPDMLERLTYALIPGPGGGERVSTSREAPLPLRLTALTLAAGGSDEARCAFIPKVRVWTTIEDVPGTDRGILVWHREPVRDERGHLVMTLADDQVGVLPVKSWLRAWALDWRRQFGHSLRDQRPARVEPTPVGRPSLADRARVLLGLGAAQAPADRDDDPAAAEWAMRWRESNRHLVTLEHRRYLSTWLDHACEHHPHIADFAASLRTLVGAMRAALGDFDDLEYLGRCPEDYTDRRTGETAVCGAALWHDPHASVITCPRCRAETGQDRRIWLARRILDTWPIDRRRRYPRGLIAILRLPTCGCGAPVTVDWMDATERCDSERFWRPGQVRCPNGCELERVP